uniref:Uncharacterized protein n=3 Tax=Noccaea caerulescens TaxID=107243 RepID=A0A1J3CU86_NOCCA
MGVAVLNPQDCLKQSFSRMKYPRNPTACPNRQKKPVPNRTRRSPPRNQASRSPPIAPPLPPRATVSAFVPKGTVKKSPTNSIVAGQIRILKRGEAIPKKTSDLVVEAISKKTSDLVVDAIPKQTSLVVEAIPVDLVVEKADLGSTRRIGPDPAVIPSQIRLSGRRSKKAPFYAGPVTMSSPPPSDVPLPAFFTTKNATNDIIRLLRIDIA